VRKRVEKAANAVGQSFSKLGTKEGGERQHPARKLLFEVDLKRGHLVRPKGSKGGISINGKSIDYSKTEDRKPG